jgi:hypothetical protein
LTEALQLQSGRQGDNELAYCIRTLISEGYLKYQYTGFIGKKKVTIVQELKGPTSLLTTTIHGQLEGQLDDRMITIHPNTTAEQTRDIISRTAEMASGNSDGVDQKTLDAWKLFYKSLGSVEVVIPYAGDIAAFINRTGSLPISSRRAFKRVLATIKTIALIHQKQRSRDDQGRVIADYADFFIAYQLVGDSFRESLGEGQRYTDDRVRLVEKDGQMTPRALSENIGVSTAAISQWLKPMIEKGVLVWCDGNGVEFTDVAELERAKRMGQAFVKVAERPCLPSPYQLTGDSRWNAGGEFGELYDLGFEESDQNEGESTVLPEMETKDSIEEISAPADSDEAVKVLSEKTGPDNNFKNERLDSGLVPVEFENLADEFSGLLQMN